MEKVESASIGSHDQTVLFMWTYDGPTGNVCGAKPSPTNVPVSEHDVRNLQHIFWAKVEGFEPRIRLDLPKKTRKTSAWSEGDDEGTTLPNPATPLV